MLSPLCSKPSVAYQTTERKSGLFTTAFPGPWNQKAKKNLLKFLNIYAHNIKCTGILMEGLFRISVVMLNFCEL